MESKEVKRSELIGCAARWLKDGSELGHIRKLLLDGKTYKVQGYVVERRREQDRVLPLESVEAYDQGALWLDSPALLLLKGADHRYIPALRHPLPLLGGRVFTVGGITLGRVDDFSFDIADGSITRLNITSNRGEALEAAGERILAISPHTVLLRDSAPEQLISESDGEFLSDSDK